MEVQDTLVLSRADVAGVLEIGECIDAVELAFRERAEGRAMPPKVLGMHVSGGGFHIKAAAMHLSRYYFVVKSNGNFPGNMRINGLPTIQGVVILCDANNGRVLAVLDSMEITLIRTGAATGVAARHLANKDSSVVTICGCGNQGRISLKALMHTHPVKQVYAYDADRATAENYALDMAASFNVAVEPVADLHSGTRYSDICVTCTTSKKPLLFKNDVREGTFIAAVGADSDDKVEIDPHLIASARLIADITEQSATIGDFHYAIEQGCVEQAHVQAELGDVIAGKKPGRTHRNEVIVFDSTGTALQDVAAAAIVYEKALAEGIGTSFNFGKPL